MAAVLKLWVAIHWWAVYPLRFYFLSNRRPKREIASKCTKTAEQILADIAEQNRYTSLTNILRKCKNIYLW